MRFKDYFYEGVTPQAQAYWISPAGETIPVIMNHIDTVLKNPSRFGLNQEYIDKVAEENGGVGELRDGGKARDVIMTEMLKGGWVRIRKVTKPYEFWTIQIENLSRTVKRNIIKWVEEMAKMNEHRLKDTVVVLDTKGNKLFGGSSNFREQKTLKDIYLDDTGVFESVFYSGKELVSESGLGRLVTHMDSHDTGTLTAFRATKDCTKSIDDEGNRMSYAENRQRQKSLLMKLQRLGYGVTSVKGSYIENYGSDEAIEVGESVFFVVDNKDTGNLKKDLVALGSEFDQDSVLFIPKGGKTAILIGTNKCPNNFLSYGEETEFENRTMGKGGEFMTKVHGRPFVFESVIIEHIERSDYSWKLGRKLGANKHWSEISVSDDDVF